MGGKPISLAESLVLVDGPRADPEDVLFVALIELVVRGGLRVVPTPREGTDGYALAPGVATEVFGRPLLALLNLVVEAREAAPEVAIEYASTRDVNHRFAVHWGSMETYVLLEVWSGLEDLGLLVPRPKRFGGRNQWRLTEEGKHERDRLCALLSAIKDWRQKPTTSLFHVRGLAIPSDEVFDTVDAIEDSLIPRYEDVWHGEMPIGQPLFGHAIGERCHAVAAERGSISRVGIGPQPFAARRVLIGSEDPRRLTEYYTKVFGKPSMEDGGYAGWKIGDGWINVGPHSEIKGRNTQPGRIILNIESSDVKGRLHEADCRGGEGRARSLPDGRMAGEHVGRDALRPGRQLLPAREPDVARTPRVRSPVVPRLTSCRSDWSRQPVSRSHPRSSCTSRAVITSVSWTPLRATRNR